MAGGDADSRTGLGADRSHLVPADAVEDRFRRQAANPVSAADEQDFHSWCDSLPLTRRNEAGEPGAEYKDTNHTRDR